MIRQHTYLNLVWACATVEVTEDQSSEDEETHEFEEDSHDEDFHLPSKARPTKRRRQSATQEILRRTRHNLVEGLQTQSLPHTLPSTSDSDEASVHHCPSCNSTRYVPGICPCYSRMASSDAIEFNAQL